jgi:CubicO group peptidase (beta-lactamase class C family)
MFSNQQINKSANQVIILAVALAASLTAPWARQAAAPEARVDAIMARWTKTTPGCAVGVSTKGASVLERAYGMADLEHDVPNTPATIFEAGSVSKQFTAAAIMLLARDGKLSLDDPARKYLPELPDYGAPLTIRQMLNHTSGLRDWGSVVGIAGWPRTTRVHTHAHVLDVIGRQRSLNFPPGTRWSYSNSGYNLAAIIVSRVSGQSFAEFTRERIFTPVGMSRTSWRDDYTRVVKDRAVAYTPAGTDFAMNMPFENVHGNGGLLTTVGDLLRWVRNFSAPTVGDAAFVKEEQEPGRFSDGRQHDYAMGLRTAPHRGVREVGHSGTTAGYTAYLADYPDRQVSVAVLCNVSSANAAQFAHAVADVYLGLPDEPAASAPKPVAPSSASEIYRRDDTGEPLALPQGASNLRVEFTDDGRATVTDQFGSVVRYTKVDAADIAPKPFTDYVGKFASDEAEVVMTTATEGEALVLKRRPDSTIRLTPIYADAFRSALGFIRFNRDAAGRVTGFSVSQDRVWSLIFTKQ